MRIPLANGAEEASGQPSYSGYAVVSPIVGSDSVLAGRKHPAGLNQYPWGFSGFLPAV